ncbi:Belongs to the histidine acid phosphatase family [Pristimantis euphronides]
MPTAKLNAIHTGWFLASYLFLCLCFLALGQASKEKKLKLVVVVFRHGDRSPIRTYPKDKYQENSWPDGFGQLTELGMKQHYELGAYLKKRYSGFLNESYSRSEVYVRSTDVDRTLMSAQANLAGLYPPVGRQIWNKSIAWRPIPIHTVPISQDKLLKMPLKNCPRYEDLLTETFQSEEFLSLIGPYKDFLNSLQSYTGYPPEKWEEGFSWWTTRDALLCETIHNYTLPKWATKDVMDKLSQIGDIGMSSLYGVYEQHEKSKLQGGVLVSSILNNLTLAAANQYGYKKLIMYSAHDTTVAALQMALNVSNGRVPPYAACHIFELYRTGDREYMIEMYYRNDSSVRPHLLTLPGCNSSCPLAKFKELTSPIIVENWEKECGAETDGNKRSGSVIGLTVAVVLLSIVVLGVLSLYCCRNKRRLFYETV